MARRSRPLRQTFTNMSIVVLIAALFLPAGLSLVVLAVRRRLLENEQNLLVSPVSKQHFELLQGSEINPALIEATKRRFQAMLERGDEAAVEARLRPGENYVVGVRALAELGTDAAGKILERQLERQLSKDRLEQTWYRIDLASGLRQLNRSESLPNLLRCIDEVGDAPIAPVFAAETLCFMGFNSYLRSPETKLGRAALGVTRRVFEGFRICLPPHVVVEGRLGDIIETIWDHRPKAANPGIVRVLHESIRYLHRMPSALAMLEDDPSECEGFRWQMSRIAGLEGSIGEYLAEAAVDLLNQLPSAEGTRLRDILSALADLRAEAGPVLVPLLQRGDFPEVELALNVLRWSGDSNAGVWMRRYGLQNIDQDARSRIRRSIFFRDAVPIPYEALLRALRGQMAAATEEFLVAATKDRDARYRIAAISSLGWWVPVYETEVIQCLEVARRDSSPDVRRGARAALARLGERSALQWFRQALVSESPGQQHEAIQFVAAECLTLLWPDLDRLVDSANAEVAHHAREALVVMSENMSVNR